MDLAGTQFEWLVFDAQGVLTDPAAQANLQALLTPTTTDLVVISHGWKTSQADALALYTPLWQSVTAAWPTDGNRSLSGFAIAGVNWPSKEFRDDFDNPASDSGGALDLPPPAGDDGDLSPAAFETMLGDFADLTGPPGQTVADAARAAQAGVDEPRATALLAALNLAVPQRITNNDSELTQSRAPLVTADPQSIFLDLMAPPPMTLSPATGSALGLGSMIGAALAGPRAAIARVLNQFTYYEMKARAGDVGAALGSRVLTSLAPPRPLRIHLIGHSFGARVVTAAAAAIAPPATSILRSMTLLEAAFSHNALAADFGSGQPGAFARVMGKVAGPITASHTHNDSACTIAYALASRLVRDNAMAIGDASDEFGAIGANGILHLTPQQYAPDQTMSANASYSFTDGMAHNVNADACISSHMDVTNAAVGRLVAAALNA